MSQHDFNIANQSFPATRTDLNNALLAIASNSSGDAEPATKYANQWWYETDTNTLKLRNEANDAWISIAVLDQSGNAVHSITTAGLTLGSTAISATGAEINQLNAITRGSILYGNASGATARLAKGGAGTVLTSDGTDISWAAAAGGGGSSDSLVFPSDWASPNNTYATSGTWSKGSLSDDDYVWIYLLGGGGGGGTGNISGAGNRSQGGDGGIAIHLYGKAGVFNGGTYVIGAGGTGSSSQYTRQAGGDTTFTLTDANGATIFTTATQSGRFITTGGSQDIVSLASFNDFVTFAKGSGSFTFTDVLPTGVTQIFTSAGSGIADSLTNRPFHTVFSGGGGGGQASAGTIVGNNSEFAGNGGDGSTNSSTVNGVFPGGGGAGSRQGLATGGNGAAGNVRVYHV